MKNYVLFMQLSNRSLAQIAGKTNLGYSHQRLTVNAADFALLIRHFSLWKLECGLLKVQAKLCVYTI